MVGKDEVKAETLRGFSLSKGPHAGVHGDDEADAFSVRGFQHGRLQTVAFKQAMRDVEARFAAEHFNGGFEQDDGGGAVDVVIAIEEDGLARGDGALDALDGAVHSAHEEGIVELIGGGVEEGEGLGCVCDAAGEEQFGEHAGDARGAGQGFSLFRMGVCEKPALARGATG
jgi:hypothetical protein